VTEQSATTALEALMVERGLASWLRWTSASSPVPDVLVLTEPRLRLPGSAAELAAREARFVGVNVPALAAGAALSWRQVRLQGLDFAGLLQGSADAPFPAAKPMLGEPMLGDASLSLAPIAGGEADQRLTLSLHLPAALTVDLTLDLVGPFGAATPPRLLAAMLRLADGGLAARLRDDLIRAASSLEEARSGLRVMLAALLFQPGPRSPLAGPLLELLPAIFDQADAQPVVTLRLHAAMPAPWEDWQAFLRDGGGAPIRVETSLHPSKAPLSAKSAKTEAAS
jgi:hypothetical protein